MPEMSEDGSEGGSVDIGGARVAIDRDCKYDPRRARFKAGYRISPDHYRTVDVYPTTAELRALADLCNRTADAIDAEARADAVCKIV